MVLYELGPASHATATSCSDSAGISDTKRSDANQPNASGASNCQGFLAPLTDAVVGSQSSSMKRESLPIDRSIEPAKKHFKLDAVSIKMKDGIETVFDPPLEPTMSSDYIPNLRELWEAILNKPKDLDSWEALLVAVFRAPDVHIAREVYPTFLHRFPLYFGYWKKWASYEMKFGDPTKVFYLSPIWLEMTCF